MLKKIISAAAAAVILLSAGVCGYAFDGESPVSQAEIYLNGAKINAEAIVQDGFVYLPVRSACEALGYTVQWSGDGDETVTARKDGESVSLNLTQQSADNNGHTFYLYGNYSGNGCFRYGGSTYLESGAFSENFNISAQYDAQSGEVAMTSLNENAVNVTTMTLNSEDENLKVTLQYPQIDGLENTDAQESINSVLTDAAAAAVREGLQNSYDGIVVKRTMPDYTAQCETYLNYRITYNQNGLLSVVLDDYQYSGGAHGSTVRSAYTFDLSTGGVLKLSDLMESGASYVSYINSAVRKDIDARVASGALYEFEDGKFTTIGDDPAFYLAGDSLVIYFQQYEYFPYAAGIQEFPIGYSGLGGMLKSSYVFLYEDTLQQGVQNMLSVGDTAGVSLYGNPTTGYSWFCTIGDESVLAKESDNYVSESDLTGAGGTYTWQFRALKAGSTTVTFKYYRSWEGEASAEKTVTYQVTVK